MIPRLSWLFLALTVLAFVVPLVLREGHGWRQLVRPSVESVFLLVVGIYIFLVALSASEPRAALDNSGPLLATALFASVTFSAANFFEKPQLTRAAFAFAAGAVIGALFVLCELLTHGAITRFVVNTVVWLKPTSGKHVAIVNGEVTKFKSAAFSQHVAMLTFYLWPALLALNAIGDRLRRATCIGLLVIAVAIPVSFSERMSSQIALFVSLFVFPLALAWRRKVLGLFVILWCLAFALMLPLSFFAYKSQVHLAPWVPSSARARIIIWEYTAEQVLKHPWFGIGPASNETHQKPNSSAEQPEGFVVPRSTASHAHNFFLQVWYDLGVVGAVLIAFAGVFLVLGTLRLPNGTQPYAIAMIATLFSTITFAWSIWQTWLTCAVALMLIYFITAAAGHQDREIR